MSHNQVVGLPDRLVPASDAGAAYVKRWLENFFGVEFLAMDDYNRHYSQTELGFKISLYKENESCWNCVGVAVLGRISGNPPDHVILSWSAKLGILRMTFGSMVPKSLDTYCGEEFVASAIAEGIVFEK
jgi:hypothetical protein